MLLELIRSASVEMLLMSTHYIGFFVSKKNIWLTIVFVWYIIHNNYKYSFLYPAAQ